MYKITLGTRVRDRVQFEDNGKRLRLTVNADAYRMVSDLNAAKETLQGVTRDSDEEVQKRSALAFAGAIFGMDQARKLLDFYSGDSGSVVAVCGKYFAERLAGKIAEVQKQAG